MRRLAIVLAVLTSASVLVSGSPALAGTLQPSGWQSARTSWAADVSAGEATLSCVTASWCLSVGRGTNMIWDGTQWNRSPNSFPDGFQIHGLSCASRWDCMVVGSMRAGASDLPIAMHWDGVSFKPLNPSTQSPDEYAFTGVSCPAAKTCFVVGALNDRVLLWQNGSWTSQPIALPAGATQIDVGDIDCPAVTNCHATAAVHFAGQPEFGSSQAMVSWDGTSWSTEILPEDQYGGPRLGAISCPAPTWCVAVGANDRGLIGDAWDGTTWRESWVPDSPNKDDRAEQEPDGFQYLGDVSCWAVNRCQAVGNTNTAPFHRIFNGTTWSSLDNPASTDALGASQEAWYHLGGIDCLYASFCLTSGAMDADIVAEVPYMEQYNP